MASLIELANDPTKRSAIVADAAQLLDAEVAEKRGFSGKAVQLPLDGAKYERRLKKLIKNSRYQKPKPTRTAKNDDFGKSF